MPNAKKRKPDQTSLFSWILPITVRDNGIVGIQKDFEPSTPPTAETEDIPVIRTPKTSVEPVSVKEEFDYSEDDGSEPFIDIEQAEAKLMQQLKKRRPIP